MDKLISTIITQICYTTLVYGRINKKLYLNLSNSEIKDLISTTILNATNIEHIRKNYYVYNYPANIRITVNAHNFRVITADKLDK
ncbi:DUF3781 domain-containing protein [Lactobacillus sp. UCMA15818]|uniref:DUF3781 domain-containing protein n=1 Tax=Lactobacillus sp. UCMA15818 TaxID=2583394 RepID=UPI0025B1A622|nr:DUF3781 domain-containing protein [Lactobacillus sp. UCMA15818]MDN2453653.1 DUF3781 domain-containing protein [Lactobacillus sp. UCMA15818]